MIKDGTHYVYTIEYYDHKDKKWKYNEVLAKKIFGPAGDFQHKDSYEKTGIFGHRDFEKALKGIEKLRESHKESPLRLVCISITKLTWEVDDVKQVLRGR